jgi:LysR family transcriptional regulator, hydrogen peroxide-inducible genes activator
MTWPTFQQLRYLVAIADAGTFGAAADEEFVTQPAISAQIKELERKLGVTLFERSSRGVIMTTQGSEVVERARVILRDMKDLVGSTHYEGDHLRGRIGLGVIPTLAPYVLPSVVRFVMSTHPKAELHIHELQTIHLLDSLRRGVIDLGLLALPVGSEEFTTESIGLDSFVLAMSETHPLAKEKSPVKLDILRDERVILLEEGHCLRDQVTQVCRLVFSEPSEVQATSMATLAQMVAAGLGVTLLPECAVKIEAAPGRGIVTRKFAGVPPNRTVGLVWRKSSPHSRAFTELAELLTDKK